MADPTIQTFCCYHDNGTEVAETIVKGFNTSVYNTICLISATLGILGAIYQILPRQQYAFNHRWVSITAARGRKIIIWLAISDLLASVGVLIRAALWLGYTNIMPDYEDDSSVWFCALTSAWIQYFYMSTWVWTLCYTVEIRFVLCEKTANSKYYHLAAWLIPAILTSIGLSLLYVPDARCHTTNSISTAILRILPNYLATYLLITIVMIANPILYKAAIKDMERVITSISGQFTSKEREIMDSIKVKFLMINMVFYICWVPNLFNGVLIWVLWFDLPLSLMITVWYIMAFLNPLQALFNCMVYRRWTKGSERVIMPWQIFQNAPPPQPSAKTKTATLSNITSTEEESVPLLETKTRISINDYSDTK